MKTLRKWFHQSSLDEDLHVWVKSIEENGNRLVSLTREDVDEGGAMSNYSRYLYSAIVDEIPKTPHLESDHA